MAKKMKWTMVLAALLLAAGCATVEPGPGFKQVSSELKLPPGPDLVWQQSEKDQALVKEKIDAALAGGLTRQESAALALLNNRSLQAAFEEIGVSQAELVQAGLFENPSLAVLVRFPIRGDESGTNIELSASFQAADMWLVPLRRKLAEAALRRATLEVADLVLETRRQALVAHDRLAYLEQMAASAREARENLRETAHASQTQRQWGYLSDIEVYQAQDAVMGAELEVMQIDMEIAQARAALERVLDLDGRPFNLSGEPGPLPARLPGKAEATALALASRVDLRLAKAREAEARRLVELERARVVKDLRVGADWERETSGEEVLGPELEMELPIFDQNQAQIARAQYAARMARKKVLALEGMAREQVSADLASLRYLDQKADLLESRVIPLRQKSYEFAGLWAGRMQYSRIVLLGAQRELLDARLELIRTRLAHAEALAGLEYHLGGRLPD